MNGVDKFGEMIMDAAVSNPSKARKLIAMGCTIQILTNYIPSPKNAPCKRYGSRVVAKVLRDSIACPEKTAMVSIFVPCEPLAAAGITPFSVEALSGFATGTHSEQIFLKKTEEMGEPPTLCSFHRVLHGAMEMDVVPKPTMLIYTNLACDANMIGFPYMIDRFKIPNFFIEVPYERSEESVHFVASQLKEMVKFVEDISKKKIQPDVLKEAVASGQRSAKYYLESLKYQKDHALRGPVESEMYGVFSGHIMMGQKEAEIYMKKTLENIKKAKGDDAVRLVWMHMLPYVQPSIVKNVSVPNRARVTALDLVYDSMMLVDSDDPYYTMAYRMVYSVYNGDYKWRAERTLKALKETGAEGVVIFEHWGCKTTFGAGHLYEEAFAKEGYPTLLLNGDGANPANCNDGQMATRLEAFIEMLRDRRND